MRKSLCIFLFSFSPLVVVASFFLDPAAAATGKSTVSHFSVARSIAIPDGMWDYASVDMNTRRLFLGRPDGVLAVDLTSGVVTPRLVAGKKVHAILPLPEGRALSTNGDGDTATLFEQASGKVLADIPTGHHPDSAAYDAASGLAIVVNILGGDVTLIDPKGGTSPGKIVVGGMLEFAATDGLGHAYINVSDRGQIALIDIPTRKVTKMITLPGCKEPTGLALDRVTGVLVSACANERAVALHAPDGRILATLPIGAGPDAVIFDASQSRFFIPCGDSGTLAVIVERSLGKPKLEGSVPTAPGTRTGAWDPQTQSLYLPTAEKWLETLHLGDRNIPRPAPGSVRILVMVDSGS
jgi:DNA-binding beta-propeller fold protein YncE